MAAFFALINKMIVLALLILLGYFAKKIKWVDESFSKNVTDYCLKIALPLLAIKSLQIDFSMDVMAEGGLVFITSCGVFIMNYLLGIVFAKIFRIPQDKKGPWLFGLMMSNVVFMGMPVLMAIYGEDMMFYLTIISIASNIFTYMFGAWIIASNNKAESKKLNAKELICTPLNFAMVLAVILFILQIRLPDVVLETAGYVSDTIVPLAMFYVGVNLAKNSVLEMLGDWQVYAYALTRLLILPIITFFVLRTFITEPMMLGTLVISASAMSSPSVTVILVSQYGGDIKFASRMVFISTVLCGISMPIIGMLVL